MDNITQHQPPIQVIDLTSDESLDSASGGSSMEDDVIGAEYISAARRYQHYTDYYSELFSRFYTEVYESVMSSLDDKTIDRSEQEFKLVDEFIWHMMDLDIRNGVEWQ